MSSNSRARSFEHANARAVCMRARLRIATEYLLTGLYDDFEARRALLFASRVTHVARAPFARERACAFATCADNSADACMRGVHRAMSTHSVAHARRFVGDPPCVRASRVL